MTDSSTPPATIAIIGPGRMGTGITQVFATNGHPVRILDVKDRPPGEVDDRFETLRTTVRSNLALLERFDQFSGDPSMVDERIACTRSAPSALADADWVFEALPEDPSIKRAALSDLHDEIPADSIVATTTSSISLTTLADVVPDPERLLITHWLNPAFIVPLVEIARTETTDDAAVRSTVELLTRVGKAPVVCQDSPGFVGSRIQAAAMNEAVRVYEDGVADPEDIDRALRTGVGFRMAVLGLIEFIDIGGVDILYHVNNYLEGALGPRFENPASVIEKMDANEIGPKTGRGYYDYEDVDNSEVQTAVYEAMLVLRGALYDDEWDFDPSLPSVDPREPGE